MTRDQMRSHVGRLIKGKPVQGDGPERWIEARRAWRYSTRIGRRQIDLLMRVE